MSTVERITDPHALRQAALLLETENQKLIEKNAALQDEIAQLRGKDPLTLQQKLQFLQELIDRQNQALFGASSEKRTTAAAEPVEKAIQGGHKRRTQSTLPLVEAIHTLDDADRVCPSCGGELRELDGQFESSEQISVIRRQFVVVQHRRQAYRCSCGTCETALGPPTLRDGARYAPEFAVEVAIAKYGDHLPLDRQVKIMRREGLTVDSQTLWDQLQALAVKLAPSYRALPERVLSPAVVFVDESPWRLMDKPGSTRWWVWSVSSSEGVFYRLDPSRGSHVAAELLAGYRGRVVADGYAAYGKLARDAPGLRLAACWAHVRRRFVDCEAHYPEPARRALDWIRELYRIEGEIDDGEEALLRRAAARSARSQPIVEQLFEWAARQSPLPGSGLGRAISYLLAQQAPLMLFLDDPRVPLDNNHAERTLRGLVVGRKNHYGSRSVRGTEVAALFYSLIESAKLLGVEPQRYLLEATLRALGQPGTVTLPGDLAAVATANQP